MSRFLNSSSCLNIWDSALLAFSSSWSMASVFPLSKLDRYFSLSSNSSALRLALYSFSLIYCSFSDISTLKNKNSKSSLMNLSFYLSVMLSTFILLMIYVYPCKWTDSNLISDFRHRNKLNHSHSAYRTIFYHQHSISINVEKRARLSEAYPGLKLCEPRRKSQGCWALVPNMLGH